MATNRATKSGFAAEAQKKKLRMDFGADNEFESDDSFFDDPKTAKKPQLSKTSEKKSLEDIFGFEDDSNKKTTSENAHKPKVRFNIDDNDEKPSDKTASKNQALDWLGGAGEPDFTTKKGPVTTKGDPLDKSEIKNKPFDLLDDILPQKGIRKGDQAKTTSFEDILKESKIPKSEPGSLLEQKSGPASLEKQDKEQVTVASQRSMSEGLSMILEPPQGHRRGRRGSSAGVTDVLGLFGSGPSSTELLGGSMFSSAAEEKKSNIRASAKEMPDWLGGSSTTLNKSDTTIISLHRTEPQVFEGETKVQPAEIKTDLPRGPSVRGDVANNPNSMDNVTDDVVPKPSSENIFQANMSNLQAQESFLLVSLQLKKYEENLSEIKHQQHEILRKQESQFDIFLNKYIEKQKGIEQEMLAQQERINQHIRMMALRGFEGENRSLKEEDVRNEKGEERDENVVIERIVKGLKQRHDEELFLMEESYKKQLSLLEKSSEQLEHRLTQETESALKSYEERLGNLKAQHKEETLFWTEKIKSLDEKHQEEIGSIKENQQRVLRDVKDEFLDQIERFKEQRNRENDLFASSTDFSQKLTVSLEKLGKNEEVLGQIQEKVVSDYNILSVARERSIENKEKDISAMRSALEKCRDQAEKDRSQLLALIRTLEQKLSEQIHNSQEERWALQQAAATIAARSAAFDREVDFSRASIERERDQLKTFKEALLAEQEKVALQLTEEKLKLSAEKSRVEVSAKLVNNYEVEKIKTEAETAIQVAKELTEKLNLERNFVQRQKFELEGFRNKLMGKERDLLEREENVEEMRRAMQQKTNEDKRLIQETKYLENRYKEKLSELQSQAISLSNREKKLAEEKLLVSKERLTLYTSMKSQGGGQKKCMLCQAEDDNNKCGKSELVLPFIGGYSVTDPEIIRLRFEALEDERNSEVSREDKISDINLR